MPGTDALNLEWFAPAPEGPDRVLCTGVFDLLHVGHVRFLFAARSAGAALIAGVEDDPRVRARKGVDRPLVPAAERAEVLSALVAVDGVFVVHGRPDLWRAEAYAELLAPIRPAALAITAGDPAEPGKRTAARMLGARVVMLPLVAHRSTSGLVARARLTPEIRPSAPRSRTPAASRSPVQR